MDKKFRNIIEELNYIIPDRDKYLIVETRASHIIASAVNLIKLIQESFTESESEELTKRLIASIKNEDQMKFKRGIKKIRENRNETKKNKSSN
jgi:hypothetical protein